MMVQDELTVALDDKIGFVRAHHLNLMGKLSEHGFVPSRNEAQQPEVAMTNTAGLEELLTEATVDC